MTKQQALALQCRRPVRLLALFISSVVAPRQPKFCRLCHRPAIPAARRDAVARLKSQLHLERNTQLAHTYWYRSLQPGDIVLDATCGNGHDTLALAEYIGAPISGTLIALDIQERAIVRTRDRLLEMFQSKFGSVPVHVFSEYAEGSLRCRLWTESGFVGEIRQHRHERIDRELLYRWLQDRSDVSAGIKVAAYNLGYLPGLDTDKHVRTIAESTVQSLERVEKLIALDGGIISISCYVGHEGGADEEAAVLGWARTLASSHWTVVAHQWLNRRKAPSLVIAQRLSNNAQYMAR